MSSTTSAKRCRYKKLRRCQRSGDYRIDNPDLDEISLYDAIELRKRSGIDQSAHGDTNQLAGFIQHTVSNSDTIQGLALKYRCSVAQIKQLNQIHTDRELYSAQVIRVPVLKHSIVGCTTLSASDQSSLNESGDVGRSNALSPTATPEQIKQYWEHIDQTVQEVADRESRSQDGQVFPFGRHFVAPPPQPAPPAGNWCWIVTSLILIAVVIPTFYALYIILYSSEDRSAIHFVGPLNDVPENLT